MMKVKSVLRFTQPSLIQNSHYFLAIIIYLRQRKFWFNLKNDFTRNIHSILEYKLRKWK